MTRRLCAALLAVVFLVGGCGWLENAREKAAAHLAKGDFPAARIEALNAIQRDENDREAYLILGQALLGQGDFITADRSLDRAAKLGVEPARVDASRARVLLKLRAYDRVLGELRPDPDYPPEVLGIVLAARGQALLAGKKVNEARVTFEAALKVVPELPEARMGQAQLAWLDRKPDEALSILDGAIARSRNHPGVWELKGWLLQSQGKIEEAVTAFDRAASFDPANIEANLAAAELSMTLRRFDAAQKYIRDAGKRFPNAVAVHHLQALLHFELKQHAEALNQLQAVFKAQPNAVPSIMLAGAVHLALGDFGQAEERFRTVLRERPGDLLTSKLYGTALLRQGKASEALKILSPALEKSTEDASLLRLSAEAHLRMRDYAKATAYYERAAQISPESAEALARVGIARIAGGHAVEGLATLEKAVALGGDDVSGDIALATILLNRGDFKRALAAAQRMQSRAPRNPIGFNLAGIALLRLNDPHAARMNFERAVDIDPGFWPAAAQLARLDLAAGQRDAAKSRIQQVLAKDANNVQSMSALMQITGDRGQFIESLETARQADPKAIAPRVVLAREYLAQGLPDRAMAVAREVVAAAPGRPDTSELLGTAQLAAGRHSEALTTFRELATRFPKSHLAQSRLATTLAVLGDFRGAESAYRKSIALQPDDSDATVGLALLYQREKRLDDALRLAEELQRNQPKRPIGYVLAGDLYLNAGRYPDAIKAYDAAFARAPSGRILVNRHIARSRAGVKPDDAALMQWIKENPNDLTVRMHIADLQYLAGQYREAAEQYESIVKLHPNLAVAWNNLASAYLKLSNSRALAGAEAAHKLRPDDAHILDTLGTAQLRFGKAEIAVDTLKKAMSRRPNSIETRVNYALALAKAGDRTGGRQELQKLVTSDGTVELGDEAKALLQGR